MTKNELKQQKADIRETLLSKVDTLNDKDSLNKVFNILNNLNENLNHHDSRFENYFDDFSLKMARKDKDKIKRLITDILDDYDKVNRDGSTKYSDKEKEAISQAVVQINDICDKNFLQKLLAVIGIGS